MMKWFSLSLVAVALAASVVLPAWGSPSGAAANVRSKKPAGLSKISAQSQEIQARSARIEDYLKKHPEDESARQRAMRWYESVGNNLARLEYHTFEMVKYHPTNEYIAWNNVMSLYLDRPYGLELLRRLEEQAAHTHPTHEQYWLVAYTAKRLAIAPCFPDELSRQDFYHYFGLPKDTVLLTTNDKGLAELSITYFHKAIDAANKDPFETSFYGVQLGELLVDLNRIDEALVIFKNALSYDNETMKPEILLDYGNCLKAAKRFDEAKAMLVQVRGCDKEGFGGPGHATTKAENILGEIALDEDNMADACRYLLSSSHVKRCCHSITQGLPMGLAKRLLEKGQYDAVIEYCRTTLKDFVPDDPQTKAVLQMAQAAKAKVEGGK